ncbi:Acetylserotonin O-methyltransferase [Actinobacteria bacterium OK074]|nr:Acetylserotonin O-methyltransferase [Actinobacteria bacterium OK074]
MTMSPQQAKAAVTIGRLSMAYRQARVIHSAVELGVFELLAQGPADESEIVARLGLHPRLARDFLSALVALDLLERADGRYRTSGLAQDALVPGSPVYLGDTILATGTRHYQAWERLSEALRDGRATSREHTGADTFARLYDEPDRARGFLAHMDSAHAPIGPQLAEFVDWSLYKTFTDIGGARGTVAADIALRHPHLRGGVLELPAIEPLFEENMRRLGTADRIDFHGGDFFTDPLPPTDVMILGHVLHDWAPADRRRLLARVHDALPPGGVLVVYDQMLDPEEPELNTVLGSLQVGLFTGGSEYTVNECRAWTAEAGLRYSAGRRLTSIGNDFVLIATKDA